MPDDVSNLHALYEQHGPALLAYLRRYGQEEAEDWLQETFVRAVRHPDRLTGAASARAWLFGVARHVAVTAVRRRRKFEALPAEVAEEVRREEPRVAEMRRAIEGLPDIHREALELRLREGLAYEEIAEVLGVPVGTVRSRLHNAVRQLRRVMHEEGK